MATPLTCWFSTASVNITSPTGSDSAGGRSCVFPRSATAEVPEGDATASVDFDPETGAVSASAVRNGAWYGDDSIRASVELFLDPDVRYWEIQVTADLDPDVPRDDGPGDLGLAAFVTVYGAAAEGPFGRRAPTLDLDVFDLELLPGTTTFLAKVDRDPSGLFPAPTLNVEVFLDFDGFLGSTTSSLSVTAMPTVPEPTRGLLLACMLIALARRPPPRGP